MWGVPSRPADLLDAYEPKAESAAGYSIEDHPRLAAGPVREVFEAFRNQVQGGRSLDEVAGRLAVSTRTLIRRLREAGTTYRELRDANRRKLAMELLSDTSLTVAEVAYRLGFEDASNFGKSCHRWFGCSAGALRKRLREPPRERAGRGHT